MRHKLWRRTAGISEERELKKYKTVNIHLNTYNYTYNISPVSTTFRPAKIALIGKYMGKIVKQVSQLFYDRA